MSNSSVVAEEPSSSKEGSENVSTLSLDGQHELLPTASSDSESQLTPPPSQSSNATTPSSTTPSPPPKSESPSPPPPSPLPTSSPPPPSNSPPPSPSPSPPPPHSPPHSPPPPPHSPPPSNLPSPPPPPAASSVSPSPPSPSHSPPPPPPDIPNQFSPPPSEIFAPPPPNTSPANPWPTPVVSYSPPPPAPESPGILPPPTQFSPPFVGPPPGVYPSPIVPGSPTGPTPPAAFIPSISPPPAPKSPNLTPPSTPSDSANSTASKHSSDSSGNHITLISATVTGVVVVTMFAFFFLIRRKKQRGGQAFPANYGPPHRPGNLIVQSAVDGYYYVQQLGPRADGFYNGRPPLSPGIENKNGSSGPDSGVIGGSLSCFSYEELMEITNGFCKQNVLGEGGFGCVYKGWLPDGRVVAVKQLKPGSGQGEREFRAEVEIISRVHHRHLVSLVGYCIAEHHRLLVYEFLPNNNLEHHLHGKGMPVMEWSRRVKIAVGAARGLAYLHDDCNPKIIHRDIKSANILLDDAFEAQVADFGLAKLTSETHTHVSTRVVGTIGYMAPEYAISGKLTDRSDVYSFGVVLLELVTGRKAIDQNQPLGDESLVEWARPLLIHALNTGDFTALTDARLEKRYVESEMLRMIEAAAACVRHAVPKRPRMVQIVRALDSQGDMLSDLTNGVQLGQSTAYDSAQYSAEIKKFRRMAFGSWESSNYDMFSGESRPSRCNSSTEVSLELEESDEFPTCDSESQLMNSLSEQRSRFKPR